MAKRPQPQGARKLTAELAPETIGFRLGIEDRKLLQSHALQAGVSAHVVARAYVEQVLRSGGDIAALLALHDKFDAFRAELLRAVAVSTATLLVSAGRSTAEAAQSWVEKNMKPD